MGKRFFIFILFFVCVLFFNLPKVLAADTDIVINELMWMGGKSSSDEWLELYNPSGSEVDISGWEITYLSGGVEKLMLIIPEDQKIASGSYYVISHYDKGSSSSLDVKPDLTSKSLTLSNDTLQIKLYAGDWQDSDLLIDTAGSGKTPLAGKNTSSEKFSMEKISSDDDGSASASWQTAYEAVNLIDVDGITQHGTPGMENSTKPKNPTPLAPENLSPAANSIEKTQTVNFSWQTEDSQDLTYEFILWQNEVLSNYVVDEPDLAGLTYEVKDLDWGVYYWKVIASNGTDPTESVICKLTLTEPIYANSIIVNELMADPTGDETENEWIELYNNSDQIVDLSGWYLEDIKGSIKRYQIGEVEIAPFGFQLFARAKTGITLNNDQDGVRLYQPNENLLYETAVFSGGKEGWSWARKDDSTWTWTSTVTTGDVNKFYIPTPDPIVEEELSVINKNPIKIKTKDYKHYQDKLVQISGQVISASGATFYLNDGSGQVKVYIQAKTEIKKPPMHKGDIFGVIGVVNIYRDVWRILPRSQDDIWLVASVEKKNTVAVLTKSVAKKTAPASSVSGNSNANGARAPNLFPPLIEQAKAASNSLSSQSTQSNTGILTQIAKFLVGLGVIFMLLLVIKVKATPKQKIVGGHFGQDDT